MHSTNNGEVPPFSPMPWWVSSVSQDEHVNSTNMNQFDWVEEHQKSDNFYKSQDIIDQSSEKETELVFQAAFSAGENKNSFKENSMLSQQTNGYQQLLPSQKKGFIELGLGQSMVSANYSSGDQRCGLFASYGTQPVVCAMLPCSLTTEDGPVYVNPKQYHGILRRRKMRAKEGIKYKSSKEKPYLHESRHRHACRRPRGAGGRFLNAKSLDSQKNETEPNKTFSQLPYQSSESSGSEVLQSESVNLNSSKQVSDTKTSNFSSSEVSSMYYNKELDCFNLNPTRPFDFNPYSNFDFFKL